MAVAALRAWVASVTVPGRDPFLELEPPLQEGGQGQRLDPTWGREGEEGCEGGGSLEGAVSLVWREGDSFQGRYEKGRRHGWGVVSGANQLSFITFNWTAWTPIYTGLFLDICSYW